MSICLRRRDFIATLGGAAAWPLAARAQQRERMRRLGWLWGGAEDDLESQADRAALLEALAKLGWIEGRNLRIELRFGAGDPARLEAYAAELVRFAPDVMLATTGGAASAAQQKPGIFRSSLPPAPTPWRLALCETLPDPRATSPDLAVVSLRSLANVWSCSRKPRRARTGLRSFSGNRRY
jgi:putative ABC transport system substrate-binding protein